jgi:hypothetical protein
MESSVKGCRQLCAAMIWRAVLDYAGVGVTVEERRDAYEWIFKGAPALLSLEKACEGAGLEEATVRKAALRARREKKRLVNKFNSTHQANGRNV